jgi:membrane associated rhomboid family serine protease
MNTQRNYFRNNLPPITKNILIINGLLWLACVIFEKTGGINLMDILGLHYFGSEGFKIHQVITYMFLHATVTSQGSIEFSHIFFNMFAVYMFGRSIEMVWGKKQFLLYYIATGIGAGIIQECVWFLALPPVYYDYALTIGASGAVFGILLAFGMLFPNAPLFLMFIPIPVKAKYMVAGYGLIELFAGVVNRSGDNVAHFAHLGGMLFGIILILYWKKKGKLYGNSYR